MSALGTGDVALLLAAGAGAGAINAAAGGGSLLSFPALIATGLSPLAANVTNLVALVPGYLAGTGAYRRELSGQSARLRGLAITAAAGAAAGTAILLLTPAGVFSAIVPFLVLLACALLAAQPRLRAVMVRRQGHAGHAPPAALHAAIGLTCIYGGYFGAGLGIVLLAVLGTLLHEDLQRLNALKGALSFVVGVVAAVAVAVFGPVHWDAALIVGAASVVGGYGGATVARRLDPAVLRWSIVIFGVAVAVWLALR
jgi:uncharacterized membrane protein YfcA